MTDAIAPHMKDRRYGKIINIASIAGRQGSSRNPPYNVSKAGVISLTQAQAQGLAPHNINVNAICPGLLWTPMWERITARNAMTPNPGEKTQRETFRGTCAGADSTGQRADARRHRQPCRLPGFRVRHEHNRPVDKRQRRPAHELGWEDLEAC